jgi:hypothetical protein
MEIAKLRALGGGRTAEETAGFNVSQILTTMMVVNLDMSRDCGGLAANSA